MAMRAKATLWTVTATPRSAPTKRMQGNWLVGLSGLPDIALLQVECKIEQLSLSLFSLFGTSGCPHYRIFFASIVFISSHFAFISLYLFTSMGT
jgi:hypothetical protein